MSDDASTRLELPLLAAGQAQKEMTVNEALSRLDLAVQASAVAGGVDSPPGSPIAGQCWIVGESPEDDWSGHAGALAGWTPDGWRFVTPFEGMVVWVEEDGVVWRWTDGVWQAGDIIGNRVLIGGQQVVGARTAAIPAPGGGGVIDVEARAAITAILDALRSHGLIST